MAHYALAPTYTHRTSPFPVGDFLFVRTIRFLTLVELFPSIPMCDDDVGDEGMLIKRRTDTGFMYVVRIFFSILRNLIWNLMTHVGDTEGEEKVRQSRKDAKFKNKHVNEL